MKQSIKLRTNILDALRKMYLGTLLDRQESLKPLPEKNATQIKAVQDLKKTYVADISVRRERKYKDLAYLGLVTCHRNHKNSNQFILHLTSAGVRLCQNHLFNKIYRMYNTALNNKSSYGTNYLTFWYISFSDGHCDNSMLKNQFTDFLESDPDTKSKLKWHSNKVDRAVDSLYQK